MRTYLLEQLVEGDSTDGVFDLIDNLTNRLQEDFDEIWRKQRQKSFIRSLTRIFALLLNTKVDSVDKIKTIIKISIKTTLKICQGKIDSQALAKEKSRTTMANEQTSAT